MRMSPATPIVRKSRLSCAFPSFPSYPVIDGHPSELFNRIGHTNAGGM